MEQVENRKWCAIDAEGDVGKAGLLGVAFYSEIVQVYASRREHIMQLLIDHAKSGYTFICHNAQYDIPVIFWQLEISVKTVYYNNRFNRGEWCYDPAEKTCEIWDTLGLSGGLSLAALGKALNLPKYDTPQLLQGIDPNKYKWFCEKHNKGECVDCYAVRDAEIAYRFMLDFQRTLAAWGIAPKRKLAGIAQDVWRTLEKPEPVSIGHPLIRKLGRQAYHGGRTETFKLGTISPLYTADVASMYPSVMRETPFPDPSCLTYFRNPKLDTWLDQYEGVAEVDIIVPVMDIPPLCMMHAEELHYPIGYLHGYWTFSELRYAVSLGCAISKVHQAAFSRKNLYPFNQFIDTLWIMRESYKAQGDPRQLIAKLLMNNLYGRLGLKEKLSRKDIYPAERGVDIRKQPKSNWYVEDGTLYLTYERNQPTANKWSNVMWAAQITAAARIKLHRYILMQGNEVVYCDTDSIFSRSPIVGTGVGMGQLQEDGHYLSGIIAAPKLYALQAFDGTWTAKARGVPRAFALEFLRTGHASYAQPIKPLSQERRKIKAGTWIQVEHESMRLPARRQPLAPDRLLRDGCYSDTSPLFVALSP